MGSEVVMNLQTPFRLFIVEFELTELAVILNWIEFE